MSTTFFIPTHKRLQPFIEYFWLMQGHGDPGNKPLVSPETRFEVVLSFADPTIWETNTQQLSLKGSFLCGMRKRPYQTICKQFDIYPKRLEREFKKHIGITPKFYSRIVRFNHALNTINQQPRLQWSNLVYDYGYFDQAHFIKEFSHFIGQTPQTYLSSLMQK